MIKREVEQIFVPDNTVNACIDFMLHLEENTLSSIDNSGEIELVKNDVTLLEKNPGQQFSGSFHPSNITREQWEKGNWSEDEK